MRTAEFDILIRKALIKWATDHPLWPKIKAFLLSANLFTAVYEGCWSWLVVKSAMDTICPCFDCVLDWVNAHYLALFSLLIDHIHAGNHESLAESFDLYISNDMLYSLADLQHIVSPWAGRA